MTPDEERCAKARQFERLHAAFVAGDLNALRAALDDPSAVPKGPMPDLIGSCLVYAVYHSPLPFIRTLLELGADPNEPVDDGFPPLIVALMTSREHPGAVRRTDVDEVVRLLLAFGADPNQRGINDYTPLHMAVDMRYAPAIPILLAAGADPDARTRIDECHTAEQLADAQGLAGIAALLARRGRPLDLRLRAGLTLLEEVAGAGEEVRRQRNYAVRLRMWLSHGDPVRWTTAWGPVGVGRLEDDGATLVTDVRTNRGQLMNGLFYGMEGMRVGGTRRLEIAPHLAYGERGVPERLDVQDACPAGVVRQVGDQGADRGARVVPAGLGRPLDRGRDRGEHGARRPLGDVVVDGDGQGVEVGEALVEEPRRELRTGADRADARARPALGAEQVEGRVHEPGAPVGVPVGGGDAGVDAGRGRAAHPTQ